MVTKRIRSEYMKKFKDPKWETYTKCYEEMLKYRLTRRLLEHTHNPWFWSGSDTDSDSGGRSPAPPPPPPPPSKSQVGAEELEECDGARREQQTSTTGPVPRLPVQAEEEDKHGSAGQGSQRDGAEETRVLQEEREEQRASSQGSKPLTAPHRDKVKDTGGPQPQQSKPSKSTRQTWRSQRVRPAPSRQPRDDSKESRHPFALYGSGEKDADMACRKTHNVGPAASTKEIHESALRAKTRREVERQIQTQRSERRRAKSADLNKARKLVQPEYNPWLTEYMRCFSARSR
ncbi:centriole, cilia and spindle-associated protein [Amphiprion ocellaris]|uniref:Centriole, cilia and spindle-associated protein n=1 Tax=Amphiprion ocellaris TaxID=80972 RepID=A0AAQ5X5A8_AMPOC|nr:centriole, cilia and spindle-associated protein [Amphiprion ocellaris]XP_023128751.2 centriole, cilia and spindle-associated protein [Amphiprion ocellaris]XP_054865871.1 centriole, cilia and spindle-associated protein [Amphiprion ocellaris]XP_054865877.1 centriole, cilia and spindle-associated protein [Amphiprion ocellaris]